MNITIRMMKEFQLNYSLQYPKKVPNMDFVINEIIKEISS